MLEKKTICLRFSRTRESFQIPLRKLVVILCNITRAAISENNEIKGEIYIGVVVWLLVVLGFNNKSTLVGHFVSSPREREKREEIVEEMKERDREESGTGMEVKTEEIKTFPLYLYLLQG